MNVDEFHEDQKHYLQGFVAGVDLARGQHGLPTFASVLGLTMTASAPTETAPVGPDARGLCAQNRVLAEGKKLTPQEDARRQRHPLDMWDDLAQHAAEDRFPKGTDVLAFKNYGLFHAAPTQNSYMCRLRFPGGIVTSEQLRGVARLAEAYAGWLCRCDQSGQFAVT
jgi:ferredoxin-nitrite reductase